MINGIGGSSVQLDIVERTIHIEAMETNIKLNATLNTKLAIRLSLQDKVDIRVASTSNYIQNVGRGMGTPSTVCVKLQVYNSLYWDPQTSDLDALSQADWGNMDNFVNPPFALIPRVLLIIKEQRAVAKLIAPKWVGQPWFQQLMDMVVDQPIRMPISPRTVIALGPQQQPLKTNTGTFTPWKSLVSTTAV